ncbi:hypothetical protein GGR53DRAFT_472266 [Hypoxylon sp. FL1150]|nr:hypothetical protein GGR53DRAFT_472266 [Hypoxylon sp. FL1150]
MPKAGPVKRQASTAGRRKPGFYPKRAKVADAAAKGSTGSEKPCPRAPIRIDSGDEEDGTSKKAGGPRTALLRALEARYPADMIRELWACQPETKSGTGKKAGVGAVYTVTHTTSRTYAGREARGVGTYDSARAANERVMSVFRREHGDCLPDTRTMAREGGVRGKGGRGGEGEMIMTRRRGTPDLDECRWWVDGDGLLSLAAAVEYASYRVQAARLEVRSDGLEGESLLGGGSGGLGSGEDGSYYDSEDD